MNPSCAAPQRRRPSVPFHGRCKLRPPEVREVPWRPVTTQVCTRTPLGDWNRLWKYSEVFVGKRSPVSGFIWAINTAGSSTAIL